MDLSGAFVNGLLSIIGYVIIFVGVYKVYQIATDIREIKDLMASARRNPLGRYAAYTRPGSRNYQGSDRRGFRHRLCPKPAARGERGIAQHGERAARSSLNFP